MTSLQYETGNCLNDCSEEKEQNSRERTPGEYDAKSKQHFLFLAGIMAKWHMYALDGAFGDRKASSSQAAGLTPRGGAFKRTAGAMKVGCTPKSRSPAPPWHVSGTPANPEMQETLERGCGEGMSCVLYRTLPHHKETPRLSVGRHSPENVLEFVIIQ